MSERNDPHGLPLLPTFFGPSLSSGELQSPDLSHECNALSSVPGDTMSVGVYGPLSEVEDTSPTDGDCCGVTGPASESECAPAFTCILVSKEVH